MNIYNICSFFVELDAVILLLMFLLAFRFVVLVLLRESAYLCPLMHAFLRVIVMGRGILES